MLTVLHKGFLLFPNTHTMPLDLRSVCSVLYFMDDGKKEKSGTICLQSISEVFPLEQTYFTLNNFFNTSLKAQNFVNCTPILYVEYYCYHHCSESYLHIEKVWKDHKWKPGGRVFLFCFGVVFFYCMEKFIHVSCLKQLLIFFQG